MHTNVKCSSLNIVCYLFSIVHKILAHVESKFFVFIYIYKKTSQHFRNSGCNCGILSDNFDLFTVLLSQF